MNSSRKLQQGRRGAIREIHSIVAREGVKALWKGVGPAMARAGALTASQLATYDESKQVHYKHIFLLLLHNDRCMIQTIDHSVLLQALLRLTVLEEGFQLHFMYTKILLVFLPGSLFKILLDIIITITLVWHS